MPPKKKEVVINQRLVILAFLDGKISAFPPNVKNNEVKRAAATQEAYAQVAGAYDVTLSQLQRWVRERHEYNDLSAEQRSRSRLSGAGRKPSPSRATVVSQTVTWLKDQVATHRNVAHNVLMDQVELVCTEEGLNLKEDARRKIAADALKSAGCSIRAPTEKKRLPDDAVERVQRHIKR